jgi:hypothetical protein
MSTKSRKRVRRLKPAASRRTRKTIALRAERFNRLLGLARDLRLKSSSPFVSDPYWRRANEIEAKAHAEWEKIQRDVRRRTKRRRSAFDSRSEP